MRGAQGGAAPARSRSSQTKWPAHRHHPFVRPVRWNVLRRWFVAWISRERTRNSADYLPCINRQCPPNRARSGRNRKPLRGAADNTAHARCGAPLYWQSWRVASVRSPSRRAILPLRPSRRSLSIAYGRQSGLDGRQRPVHSSFCPPWTAVTMPDRCFVRMRTIQRLVTRQVCAQKWGAIASSSFLDRDLWERLSYP